MTRQEASAFVRDLRGTFSALEALPMPTIACVDGWVPGPIDAKGSSGRLFAGGFAAGCRCSLTSAAWLQAGASLARADARIIILLNLNFAGMR